MNGTENKYRKFSNFPFSQFYPLLYNIIFYCIYIYITSVSVHLPGPGTVREIANRNLSNFFFKNLAHVCTNTTCTSKLNFPLKMVSPPSTSSTILWFSSLYYKTFNVTSEHTITTFLLEIIQLGIMLCILSIIAH